MLAGARLGMYAPWCASTPFGGGHAFYLLLTKFQSIQIAALGVALGSAKAGLAIAEGALNIALRVMSSDLFKELKEAWYRASEAVDTVARMVAAAVQQARDQLENARKLLSAAELALKGDFEAAERKAKAMVDNAQKLYDKYAESQRLEAEKLRLELQALKNSVASTAVTAAEGALEVAKNNNIAFEVAQKGLEAVKTIEGAIYVTLDEMLKATASICDIRVARLSGTFTAKKENQKPFKIYLEGTLVKKDFKLDLDYTPGETQAFLKSMASAAIAKLK